MVIPPPSPSKSRLADRSDGRGFPDADDARRWRRRKRDANVVLEGAELIPLPRDAAPSSSRGSFISSPRFSFGRRRRRSVASRRTASSCSPSLPARAVLFALCSSDSAPPFPGRDLFRDGGDIPPSCGAGPPASFQMKRVNNLLNSILARPARQSNQSTSRRCC